MDYRLLFATVSDELKAQHCTKQAVLWMINEDHFIFDSTWVVEGHQTDI